MSLQVSKITEFEDLQAAFKIRKEVFVDEQKVDPEKESDEFEDSSSHFLATLNGEPVGTARWRLTPNGVKLERFAVIKEVRSQGVGSALVARVLEDISSNEFARYKQKYLHAQLSAIPLYLKFGFEIDGEVFEECNLLHHKMKLA
jgi:predicted GNAT family N-acyltransferase